jgi:hypothetical protein
LPICGKGLLGYKCDSDDNDARKKDAQIQDGIETKMLNQPLIDREFVTIVDLLEPAAGIIIGRRKTNFDRLARRIRRQRNEVPCGRGCRPSVPYDRR